VADRICVVGVGADGAPLSANAAADLAAADLVIGSPRHLESHAPAGRMTAAITADIDGVLETAAAHPGRVCVLASGDPGFFGILRPLVERFGSDRLTVHPAVSSVAAAFARVGLPWDDAVVVSAHGRPLPDAVSAVMGAAKAAVLVSPDNPPEVLAKALMAAGGAEKRRTVVCSRLGTPAETVTAVDLAGLAAGTWDPLSVVLILPPDGPTAVAARPTLAWGRPDHRYIHRDGMITKAEVRAVVLGKLALPAVGVMWDVGAGSGSVGIEAAGLAPGLQVWAVDRDGDAAAQTAENAGRHGVSVEVVTGEAPEVLAGLPDPDRLFVGGGGLAVLEAAVGRLRPGGRVVATYAGLERAAAAAGLLGHLVQVGVARGRPLADGGLRLSAENPIFVAWGPDE